jgi:hypothetical protein
LSAQARAAAKDETEMTPQKVMSALSPKADINRGERHVC